MKKPLSIIVISLVVLALAVPGVAAAKGGNAHGKGRSTDATESRGPGKAKKGDAGGKTRRGHAADPGTKSAEKSKPKRAAQPVFCASTLVNLRVLMSIS